MTRRTQLGICAAMMMALASGISSKGLLADDKSASDKKQAEKKKKAAKERAAHAKTDRDKSKDGVSCEKGGTKKK